MTYVFSLFIIFVIGFVCYRMIKKKSIPSNRYTPYDDITMGIKDDDIQQDNPIHDTKHHIQYEEKSNDDKTV
ncbi:DUF3951 domain-containing protein [Peribacillus simplex]|uniref:DUF3951 domain-containing protein n=1 Tax=Peribacillus TaxID=2675229 RepID=UPI00177FBD47|nr:DUF3951 domain-containing protein [Brevibacillus sp. JNUCC-41]QOS91019.1 DUF3951 domain-containing protein [Brevibacillus sp. JNUCC-41]